MIYRGHGDQMDSQLFGDALSKFLHSFFSIGWALKGRSEKKSMLVGVIRA